MGGKKHIAPGPKPEKPLKVIKCFLGDCNNFMQAKGYLNPLMVQICLLYTVLITCWPQSLRVFMTRVDYTPITKTLLSFKCLKRELPERETRFALSLLCSVEN